MRRFPHSARLRVVVTALVATLMLDASANAQPAPPPAPIRTVTLPEALAYARANQPAIRAALSRVAARQADAAIPRAQWRPVIGATLQLFGATSNNTTGTYVAPSNMDIPRIGGTPATPKYSLTPYASTFAGIAIGQEIFDFGRIAAQAAADDALVDVERQRARNDTLDVTFSVEEAYYAVVAAKKVVDAAEGALQRSRTHRDFAKAGAESGMRPPIDLARAEADLARFDLGRIRARGGLMSAQSVLAAAVGVSDAMLDAAPPSDAPQGVPTLADALQQAAARDPRLLETVAQLKAQEARTRAIGAELRPDLSLTGTLSARAGGATTPGADTVYGVGFLPYIPNWDVGLIFSLPILDPTVNARERASQAREQVQRDEIAVVRQKLLASVQQAYVTVELARSALPALQRSVEAARANYAQADARFRNGLGTSVELADAEALRADTETQLALGEFEIARARAALGRVIAEGR